VFARTTTRPTARYSPTPGWATTRHKDRTWCELRKWFRVPIVDVQVPVGVQVGGGPPARRVGSRILATLAHRLRVDGGRWGVAAICIGVGQALAVVLENVDPSQP